MCTLYDLSLTGTYISWSIALVTPSDPAFSERTDNLITQVNTISAEPPKKEETQNEIAAFAKLILHRLLDANETKTKQLQENKAVRGLLCSLQHLVELPFLQSQVATLAKDVFTKYRVDTAATTASVTQKGSSRRTTKGLKVQFSLQESIAKGGDSRDGKE